jgi:hypothetical protein
MIRLVDAVPERHRVHSPDSAPASNSRWPHEPSPTRPSKRQQGLWHHELAAGFTARVYVVIPRWGVEVCGRRAVWHPVRPPVHG